LKLPSLATAVEVNKQTLTDDEWFEDPDDLDRVESALASGSRAMDAVEAAALVPSRSLARKDSLRGTSEQPYSLPVGFSIATDSMVLLYFFLMIATSPISWCKRSPVMMSPMRSFLGRVALS